MCELDLIFNFQKAYAILDELIIAGELQESSKKAVLRIVRIRSLRMGGVVWDSWGAVQHRARHGPPQSADVQVAQSDAIEEGESLATSLKESGF